MKLNKIGLIACGLYTIFFIPLHVLAHFIPFELAIGVHTISLFPVGFILVALSLSLGAYRLPYSWLENDYVLYSVNVAIIYLAVCAMPAVARRLERLDERLLDWLEKRAIDGKLNREAASNSTVSYWKFAGVIRLSKGGLAFCAVYVCYLVLLSALEMAAPDPKGAWLLGQLSVLPGLFFLEASGLSNLLEPYLKDYPWLNSGMLTIPVSLVIVYLLGSAIVAFIRYANGKLQQEIRGVQNRRER